MIAKRVCKNNNLLHFQKKNLDDLSDYELIIYDLTEFNGIFSDILEGYGRFS